MAGIESEFHGSNGLPQNTKASPKVAGSTPIYHRHFVLAQYWADAGQLRPDTEPELNARVSIECV